MLEEVGWVEICGKTRLVGLIGTKDQEKEEDSLEGESSFLLLFLSVVRHFFSLERTSSTKRSSPQSPSVSIWAGKGGNLERLSSEETEEGRESSSPPHSYRLLPSSPPPSLFIPS